MILRIICFIGIVMASAFVPTWVFVLALCVYALSFTAYELIFLALLLDGFYGATLAQMVPYYTITTTVLVLFAEWIKPYISRYNVDS